MIERCDLATERLGERAQDEFEVWCLKLNPVLRTWNLKHWPKAGVAVIPGPFNYDRTIAQLPYSSSPLRGEDRDGGESKS